MAIFGNDKELSIIGGAPVNAEKSTINSVVKTSELLGGNLTLFCVGMLELLDIDPVEMLYVIMVSLKTEFL
jgi:hypothetical protein